MSIEALYVIVDSAGLFFMQMGVNEYSFIADVSMASKFFAEENARLKIKKLPSLSGLTVIRLRK